MKTIVLFSLVISYAFTLQASMSDYYKGLVQLDVVGVYGHQQSRLGVLIENMIVFEGDLNRADLVITDLGSSKKINPGASLLIDLGDGLKALKIENKVLESKWELASKSDIESLKAEFKPEKNTGPYLWSAHLISSDHILASYAEALQKEEKILAYRPSDIKDSNGPVPVFKELGNNKFILLGFGHPTRENLSVNLLSDRKRKALQEVQTYPFEHLPEKLSERIARRCGQALSGS